VSAALLHHRLPASPAARLPPAQLLPPFSPCALSPPPDAPSSSPPLPPPLAAGLLFGASPHTLTRAPLSLFATVGHKSDELLSHAGSKKGGMKKGVAVRAGPVMKIAGLHSDGQPIQLQLQATAREGIRSRLLVKITVLAPRRGDPLLVKQLLGEAPMVDAHAAKKAATSVRHAPSMAHSAGGAAAAAKAVAQVDAGAAKRGGVKFAEGDDDDDENEELEEPQSGSDSSVDSIRPLKASTLAKMPKAEGGTETRIAGASCPPAFPPARLPPAAFALQCSTMHSTDDSCAHFLPLLLPSSSADWVQGMSKDLDGVEAEGRGGRVARAADSDSGSDPGMEASAMRRVSREPVRARACRAAANPPSLLSLPLLL